MSFDIELVVGFPSDTEIQDLRLKIKNSYVLEDRRERGWGWCIRKKKKTSKRIDSVDSLVTDFLHGLGGVENEAKRFGSILRIAVYNNMATYTLRLEANSISMLSRFGVSLDVSIYPTS